VALQVGYVGLLAPPLALQCFWLCCSIDRQAASEYCCSVLVKRHGWLEAYRMICLHGPYVTSECA
jgi:hypothetical protein